jgi:hypothetical protein
VRSREPVRLVLPPALAFGAFAVGALAVGALAIGYLAIRRLAVKRARFQFLEIDDLVIHRLHEPHRINALPPASPDDDPWAHPENSLG